MRTAARWVLLSSMYALALATSGCSEGERADPGSDSMEDAGASADAAALGSEDGGGANGAPMPDADASTRADARSGSSADATVSQTDGGVRADGGVRGDGGVRADGGLIVGCDPIAQTGCTAPASKCIVDSTISPSGTRCALPGTMNARLGEPCANRESCEPGLACVASTSGASTCSVVCDPNMSGGCAAAGANFACRTQISRTPWAVCSELPDSCDPFMPSACASTEACQPFQELDASWTFRCRVAGAKSEGETCGSGALGCQAGLLCVHTAADAICRRYCRANADCSAGTSCIGQLSVQIDAQTVKYCHP